MALMVGSIRSTATLVDNPQKPSREALDKLKKAYPPQLFTHLSVEKLYALPEYIIKEGLSGEGEYNHFPFNPKMPHAVRGTNRESGRVFIAVRYVDEGEENPVTRIDTCFQRYKGNTENWAVANKNGSYIHVSGGMRSEDFGYLARLIQDEPCGPRFGAQNEGRRTFRNKSVVHLGTTQYFTAQ